MAFFAIVLGRLRHTKQLYVYHARAHTNGHSHKWHSHKTAQKQFVGLYNFFFICCSSLTIFSYLAVGCVTLVFSALVSMSRRPAVVLPCHKCATVSALLATCVIFCCVVASFISEFVFFLVCLYSIRMSRRNVFLFFPFCCAIAFELCKQFVAWAHRTPTDGSYNLMEAIQKYFLFHHFFFVFFFFISFKNSFFFC